VIRKSVKWGRDNKDKRSKITKGYYSRNSDKVRKNHSDYYKNNPVKKMERYEKIKEWGQNNKEKRRESCKRWYNSHREYSIQATTRWIQNNRDRRRSTKRISDAKRRGFMISGGGWRGEDIEMCFEEQGGLCAGCGCDISEGFHRDHVMPLALDPTGHHAKNLQLLCPHCNTSKNAKHPLDWYKVMPLALKD
jgi:5-methylcytosine-specific restriction endonuclease McrA